MKRTLLFIFVGTILSGCGREPLADCDNGLCGHTWALELDSAVTAGEARMHSQPDNVNGLLGLADAYLQKASFIKNQTDTRADFWLSSNLKKIDRLLDEALKLCDKVLQQKQDAATAYQFKGRSFRLKMALAGCGKSRFFVLCAKQNLLWYV